MAVDPYLGNIFEIPFGTSGMIAHENRWLAQPSELVRAENVTFENDVLQKDPSFLVYDPVGIDAAAYDFVGTSTAAGNWQAGISIASAVSPTFFSVVKNIVSPGQTSPWTFTVAVTVPVGAGVIISLYQPGAISSVTDSQGNLYILTALNSAPSDPGGLDYYQFQGIITTQLVNAVDTITLTWSGGATNPQLIAGMYSLGTTGFDTASAAPAATVTLNVPPTAAPFVAARNLFYPMMIVGGFFLDKDTATATVTPGNGFSILNTANRAGVGQLSQFFKSYLPTPAIIAQEDWNSQFNAGAIAGTVTVTRGATTIIGAGTAFLTAFSKNDEIVINGEVQSINTVTNNGTLDTYNTWTQATAAGQVAIRRAGPRIVTAALTNLAAASGSAIFKEAGQGLLAGFTIHVNLGQQRLGRFVIGGKEAAAQSRKLFYFNGYSVVSYLPDDATNMIAIATPPADWGAVDNRNTQPINGIVHQNALFGFGNLNDPHRIYRSQTADHTVFTGGDSGQYPIASSIGERLWGAAEFQGVLFLWKYPRGIFYFDDTDSNFINWSYHTRSEALGCAPSPYAVVPIDDDVLFCAPNAHFHLLSAVPALGGVRTSDITRLLGLHRWTRENIDVPSLGQMTSTYNAYAKTAYFGVRSKAATTQDNDLLLKFDFGQVDRGGAVRFSYSTAFRPNALCIRRSANTGNPKDGVPLLMIGEISTSILQILDDGTVNTALTHGFRNDPVRQQRLISTSYPITAALPRLDFANVDPMNRQRRKNFDSIEFIFGESGISDLSGQTLTAQIFVDGTLKQTITIANIVVTRVLRELKCGDGFDWSVTLSTSSTTSAAAVTPTVVPDIVGLGLQVYWRPGGQDHSRRS